MSTGIGCVSGEEAFDDCSDTESLNAQKVDPTVGAGQTARPTVQDVGNSRIDLSREAGHIVFAHPVKLFRDCFKRALQETCRYEIKDYSSVNQAVECIDYDKTVLVVLGLRPGFVSTEFEWLDTINEAIGDRLPVVVTGDCEDPHFVTELLSKGVRGYIPTSLDLAIVGHALGLISAGGVFAPASCLMNLHSEQGTSGVSKTGDHADLTAKQMAVVEAIRRGKPNKTIAYELNMCESTVKVHVRNIMKKLHARNRTQIAYIANEMFNEQRSTL